jgi:hypothetical protein
MSMQYPDLQRPLRLNHPAPSPIARGPVQMPGQISVGDLGENYIGGNR